MLTALFPEAADPTLSFDGLEVALRSGASVPARLLARARADLPAHYGRHDRPLFAAADADWFAHRLAADAGVFRCADTSTEARRKSDRSPRSAIRWSARRWRTGVRGWRHGCSPPRWTRPWWRLGCGACDRLLDDDASDVDTRETDAAPAWSRPPAVPSPIGSRSRAAACGRCAASRRPNGTFIRPVPSAPRSTQRPQLPTRLPARGCWRRASIPACRSTLRSRRPRRASNEDALHA